MRNPAAVASLLLALAVTSCRDEQAGPKPRPSQAPNVLGAGSGVRTLDSIPADLTFRSGATWAGGAVAYIGSKLTPPSPTPGQQFQVAHYFVALRAPPQGYRFFSHLIDATNRQMLGNLDHELQGGAAPLGSWPVGKIIEDTQMLQMQQMPGTARIVLGFWNDSGRLPVDSPAAQDGDMRMLGPVLGAQEPPLPEYRAVRAEAAPKIDGDLSDVVWAKAATVELIGSFDGRKVQRKTMARVAYDDRNVYLAFDSEDPDAWGTLHKHDDPIYNEEVVEAFFDANGDGRSYNELQVSPNNVTFDAAFVARRSDLETAKKWESGMRTAVKVRGTVNNASDQDQGWSAEMEIPIANLTEVPRVPPQKGDRWRFNLYRLEHLERQRAIEGQSFSPLFVGDFHHLPRFGWLIFD